MNNSIATEPSAGYEPRPHPLDGSHHVPPEDTPEASDVPTLDPAVVTAIGASATDALSNLTCSGGSVSFDYLLSQSPYYQWWGLYEGNMRDYAYWGKYADWDWFYTTSSTSKSGRVSRKFGFVSGRIYTVAMFKDPTKNSWQLSDYIEFRAP